MVFLTIREKHTEQFQFSRAVLSSPIFQDDSDPEIIEFASQALEQLDQLWVEAKLRKANMANDGYWSLINSYGY